MKYRVFGSRFLVISGYLYKVSGVNALSDGVSLLNFDWFEARHTLNSDRS